MIVRFFPSCVVVAMMTVALAAEEPAPSAAIVYDAVLSDEEYSRRSGELGEARDDLRRRATTEEPSEGIRISQVAPGELAERRGFEVDDVICKRNGDITWSARPNWDDEDELGQIDLFDRSAGRMKSFRFPEQRIGIRYEEYWNPALRYLRTDGIQGEWDDHVLNACLTLDSDPKFSEAALFRAMRDGCPPAPIVTEIGILTSLRSAQSNRAGALLDTLDWTSEEPSEELHPVMSMRAALANNRLETAAKIVKANPRMFGMNPDTLLALSALDRLQAETAGLTLPLPAPSEAVGEMERDNLVPHLVGQTWHSVRYLIPAIKGREPYTRSVDAGNYVYYKFGVDYPIQNMEYRAKVSLKPSTARGTRWGKEIKVSIEADDITNPEVPELGRFDIAQVHISEMIGDPEGRALIGLEMYDEAISYNVFDPTIRMDGENVIDVRIWRVNGRCEVQLNGNRVLLLPVSMEYSVHGVVQIIGVEGTVHQIEFSEWIPKDK